MMGVTLMLLSGLASAGALEIEATSGCERRAKPALDADVVDGVEAGFRADVWDVAGDVADPWFLVKVDDVSGWLGPSCEVKPVVDAPPKAKAATKTVVADAEPRLPSYGGIFLGRAGSGDPVLGAGGQRRFAENELKLSLSMG